MDAYYNCERDPHYYVGDTYSTERIGMEGMTAGEIVAYNYGYDTEPERKDWGYDVIDPEDLM
jgi:hypothetical protein